MKNNNDNFLIIIYLSLFLFSFLTGISNIIFYPNFFYKYFNFSPFIIYTSFVVYSYYYHYVNTYGLLFKITHKFAFLMIIVMGFLYLSFNTLESLTYTNFVFSKFHIHPDQLSVIFYIFLAEYTIGINFNSAKKNIQKGIVKLLKIETLIVPLVIFIFLNNIVGIVDKMKDDVFYMSTHIFSSTEEKYEFKLGKKFYNFTEFIINNTEKDSKILIPPFPAYPWPQSGNSVYMRYFLFPRTLVSGNEFSPVLDINQFDYVLIAWGETPSTSGEYTHGWPKFDVPAEYILFLNDNGTTSKANENYVYDKYKDNEVWGIIKVNKLK